MTLSEFDKIIPKFFESIGASENVALIIYQVLAYLFLIVFAVVIHRVTALVLRKIVHPFTVKSKTHFDDLLIKNRFFIRIALLVPALLIYYSIDSDLFIHAKVSDFLEKLTTIFFYIIASLIFESLLSTINDYYNRFHIAKDHPISGIVQVLKILVYILALLGVIGFVFNKDLSSLLLGMGTLSAVLMLIFRDPILGFVGGLQLIFNKMIAIGDWITMPKYGADGTVLEINLTTVKVQNFDKTIVTLPTYSLISDSFQNWRGMEESGGRRIKRSINIDMASVKFCDKQMLAKFREIDAITKYIKLKEEEIDNFNSENNINPAILVNGRRQTNIGVFREYLKAYLRRREDINKNMTFLVRQLQPSEKGIPIQIYVFATTIEWAKYEDIQADIFDHILAVIPEFGLRIFQFPTNGGISGFLSDNSKTN
ncbi:MAG: mechanosensitive ion channel [Bacteroidetes bacterium]|nr:mechanosensitive ion channel [Bacteroidota bacterium]